MPPPRTTRPHRFVHLVLSAVLVALATTVPAAPASAVAPVDRLWGSDRYATAASISAATFAPGVGTVFVATGRDFPDSLAGGPAAAAVGAPILLVNESTIPTPTRLELARLKPSQIVILGGSGVVSDGVAGELSFYSGNVFRYGGRDRYETAAQIAFNYFAKPLGNPVAYIATGRSFPDALAAGAAAAKEGGPVLLVEPNSIPEATQFALSRVRPNRIVVVGGPAVVSDAVLNALGAYTGGGVFRYAGLNRYGTAAAISSALWGTDSSPTVFLASGLGFADAVAGVPAAAAAGAPLLLSAPTSLPSETASELRRMNPSRVVLLGGPGALSDAVGSAAGSVSTLTLVGPWAFAMDAFNLQSLDPLADQLIYNGSTLLGIYGGVEQTGGVYMERAADGNLYDHPVGQAQYVVNMLRNYRLTQVDPANFPPDPRYLQLAITNADRLLSRAVSHGGGIFFPYPFDFGLHGRGTLRAPWYSGMSQGIALSGFVRLYEWTKDPKWLDAANKTYASFLVRPEPGKPWVAGVDGGLLWFEEYPWTPFDHTYNGHNFAMFGMFDYWRLTGNEDARRLVLGALTTTARLAGQVRVAGGVSNYCLAQSCLDRQVRNRNYHLVHISQSLYLFRYTRDERFAQLADAFVADSPDFRIGGTTVFAPGTHTAYAFDGAGNGTPAKTETFGTATSARYEERSVPFGWIRPGNGVWFYMSGGTFAGLWIPESAVSYSKGFVDRYGYMWPRSRSAAAGLWTGYAFDPSGNLTGALTVATGDATWSYDASARINGHRATLMTDGPLAGYWVPVDQSAGLTGLDGGVASLGVADVSTEATTEAQADAGQAPPPPVPTGQPVLPDPLPGQAEIPTD